MRINITRYILRYLNVAADVRSNFKGRPSPGPSRFEVLSPQGTRRITHHVALKSEYQPLMVELTAVVGDVFL